MLVRESSTEPIVSLRLEAFQRESFERLMARCLSAVEEARELLLRQIRDAG